MRKALINLARMGWVRAALIVGGLTLAGVAVATAQGPAAPAGVQKVRFGGDRNETRIVIDLDRAAAGRLVSDGADGQRLVMTLPNVIVSGDLQGTGQGLVKRWVIDEAAGGAGGPHLPFLQHAQTHVASSRRALPMSTRIPPG